MDNDFFSNSGIPPPPLHLESSPESFPSHPLHFDFDSALSSMVTSPAASNSNISAADPFAIRELIGKLGSIGNSSGEISPHSGHRLTASSYNTPLSSPPTHLGKSPVGPLNSTVAEFSADPGFAERAARFSCFGSRSFNGRTNAMTATTTMTHLGQYRSNPLLTRVSSSPVLKTLANSTQMNHRQRDKNKNKNSPNSQDESTLSEQNPIGENENGLRTPNNNEPNSRKRKAVSKGKDKESASPKGIKAEGNSGAKKCKPEEANGNSKTEDEKKQNNNNNNNNNQKPPEPPKDYIHVRARRGQATDSHSLAERVRREKISERMKFLQDLVPGCNKVTGKALMLDEIINYMQSLQRQVEFLSMKLASVNTRTSGFNMDSIVSKDIFQTNDTSMPQPMFQLDSSASAFFGQQNQTIHCNISNGTPNKSSVDPLDSALCRSLGLQLPQLDGFGEQPPQYQTFCQDDLQSLVQMGFAHNNVNGSTQEPSPMKIEL